MSIEDKYSYQRVVDKLTSLCNEFGGDLFWLGHHWGITLNFNQIEFYVFKNEWDCWNNCLTQSNDFLINVTLDYNNIELEQIEHNVNLIYEFIGNVRNLEIEDRYIFDNEELKFLKESNINKDIHLKYSQYYESTGYFISYDSPTQPDIFLSLLNNTDEEIKMGKSKIFKDIKKNYLENIEDEG